MSKDYQFILTPDSGGQPLLDTNKSWMSCIP